MTRVFIVFNTRMYELPFPFIIQEYQEYALQYNFTGVSLDIDWLHFVLNIKISKFRCKNHEELMETLKDVNQIIQQSARLRIGKSKVNPIKIRQ